MKATKTLSAQNFFRMIATGLFLTISGSASAVEISPELQTAVLQVIPSEANNTAIEHCGCDNKKGIEMYVQNLINDAKKRGLGCQSSYHIPACITTYCSICKGHSGLVEKCIKTGIEYFTSSADFCSENQKKLAFYMPDMHFLNQFQN